MFPFSRASQQMERFLRQSKRSCVTWAEEQFVIVIMFSVQRLLLPLPFCFLLAFFPSPEDAAEAFASSAPLFFPEPPSNDLSRAFARSSAIFSASLLLSALLSDCTVVSMCSLGLLWNYQLLTRSFLRILAAAS